MSIVVESVSTLATGSGASITITKPTGLQVGDLMVANIGAHNTNDIETTSVSTKSGWSNALGANYATRVCFSVQYRIAEAADVGASNFTFDLSNANMGVIRGSILRCSGAGTLNPVGATDSETQTGINSETFTGSLTAYTPGANGALVIMQVGLYNTGGGGVTVSDYTASGVSFAELYDVSSGSSNTSAIASAYGIQTTAAALSTYSATIAQEVNNLYGQFVVILPPVNASASNTLVTTTSLSFAQSGTCDTIGGTNALTETDTTLFAQGGRGTSPDVWVDQTKTSGTWTDQTK